MSNVLAKSDLDKKDYDILRELDLNFRQPFSVIAKNVNLSKNSVALRFKKLESYIGHSLTAIDYNKLGFTEVRVFYTFDYYNKELENEFKDEVKKHKDIVWVARLYGLYDISVCFIVRSMADFISQISAFNSRFENRISHKDIEILKEIVHFRHNYLHKDVISNSYAQKKVVDKIELTNVEKTILSHIITNPRMKITDLALKTGITSKTISQKIKELHSKKIIKGFFMTLKSREFGYDTFKLLLQVHHTDENKDFVNHLHFMKNVRFIGKSIGRWDYEIDCIYPNINSLQEEIEKIKEKFPSVIKHIQIISFGQRIFTNNVYYLN